MTALLQRAATEPPLANPPGTMLRQGSRGPEVAELQEKLNRAGAEPPLVPDGIFGSLTRAAVVTFQSTHGLDADGIAGPKTRAALDADIQPLKNVKGEVHGRVLDGNKVIAQDILLNPTGKQAHDSFGSALGAADATDMPSVEALAVSVNFPAALSGQLGPLPDPVRGNLPSLILSLTALKVLLTGSTVPTAEMAPVLARIEALISLYGSTLSPGKEVSAQRLNVVSIAMSQIGIVNDRQPAGIDPTDGQRRQLRTGADQLNEYFRTAYGQEGGTFPTGYDVGIVRHISRGVPAGADDANLQEWCGIFALWAYKSGGVSLGTWKGGAGISSIGGFRAIAAAEALPGDLRAELANPKHIFILAEKRADGSLVTIEGNTGGGGPSGNGGQVNSQSKRRIDDSGWVWFRPDDFGSN